MECQVTTELYIYIFFIFFLRILFILVTIPFSQWPFFAVTQHIAVSRSIVLKVWDNLTS